jgi:exodeoxyribonuclease VII large subunit
MPASGHLYFTLKDANASLSCVVWRSQRAEIPFRPENGMTVIVHGRIEVYDAQGRYQLYADRLEPSGVGALALAVEQRRRALAAEGLFDEARKRALPLLPRRVVVVTSRSGAALRDVLTVVGRRAPGVDLVLSPATVQGEGAVETLILALERAQSVSGAEVVLLVRGGGSLEDLMPFNDERLARAIRAGRLASPPIAGRPRPPPPPSWRFPTPAGWAPSWAPAGPASEPRRARSSPSSGAPSNGSGCVWTAPRRSGGCPVTARSWTSGPSACGPACSPR